VSEKSHEIIELMRNIFFLKDAFGVSHAYKTEFFSFFKYRYLNYWIASLIIIDNALTELQPSLILVPPSTDPKDIKKDLLPITPLFGHVCQLYASLHGYKVLTCGKVGSPNKEEQRFYKSTLGVTKPEFLRRFLFNIQLFGYKFLSHRKNVIWATNSAYNIPRVMDYLNKKIKASFLVGGSDHKEKRFWLRSIFYRKSWHFLWFPSPSSRRDLNIFFNSYDIEIEKITEKIRSNAGIFSFMGVDLQRPIIDYLKNGLKSRIKDTFYGSQSFARAIKVKKPYFLISNQATGYHYAIGELCAMEKIKGMLISHGTHVSHSNKVAKREWNEQARYMINSHFPLVAVQTVWAQGFLNDQISLVSKNISTGPLLFSKRDPKKDYMDLRKKLFLNQYKKKIILHAATAFGWNNFHPWVDLTHDEYLQQINNLIKSVEQMSNVFLAIRIRLKNFPGMSLEAVKRLLIASNCYEIYTEGSFEDYLLCSDLLVSFSSTTIEEALQLRVPVLQYDPFDRYSHIPAKKLNKNSELKVASIYYVSGSENLSWTIDWIIKNHLDIPNSQELIDWSPHIINFSGDWILPIIGKKDSL